MLSKLKNKLQSAFTRQNIVEICSFGVGMVALAGAIVTLSKPEIRSEVSGVLFWVSAALIGASAVSNAGRVQRGAVTPDNEKTNARDYLSGGIAGFGMALFATAPLFQV